MTPWASDGTIDEKSGPIPGSSRATSGGITVTFRDVNVEVNGLGEDYQTTCASALSSLVPALKGSSSKRVCSDTQENVSRYTWADHPCSSSFKTYMARFDQARW